MKTQIVPALLPEINISTSYLTISDLQSIGLSRREISQLWGSVDNSQYRLFFESFSRVSDYQFPIKHDASNNQVAIATSDLLAIPNELINLDPKKVSLSLLKSFGIVDPKAKHYEIDPTIVNDLRTIFSSMTPVPDTNNRIQVITQESPGLAQLSGRSQDLLGSLIYFRREINCDHKVVMRFSSVSGAYRKTLHEENHQRKEVEELTRLAQDVVELRNQVGEWGKLGDVERRYVQDFAESVSDEVGEQLRNVLLLSKILGRDQVLGARKLSDRTGRKNPNATWPKLHAAFNKFSKRIKSVTQISTANLEDRLALVKYRSSQLAVFRKPEVKLASYFDFEKPVRVGVSLPADSLSVFKEGKGRMGVEATETQLAGYLTYLGLNPRILSVVEARPYLTFKKQLDVQIEELLQSAQRKDPAEGNKVLGKIYHTLCLVRFQEKVDSLAELLVGGGASFSGFLSGLKKLQSESTLFYLQNQSDLQFAEGFARQLELFDLVKIVAEDLNTAVSDKEIRKFKEKFFAKLSFEKLLLPW